MLMGGLGGGGYYLYQAWVGQQQVLRRVIARFQADSRVAEVLVTNVTPNINSGQMETTIKFLEYDVQGQPLTPQYFTFSGNIIQFQSLVIRFQDDFVRQADAFRGKSIYLFWKVFMLDGPRTQEYIITPMKEVPRGYQLNTEVSTFETRLWQEFWTYGLDPAQSAAQGIKNAQIEAPGQRFIPGYVYTIRIEHDGGLRIDTQALSPVLRGEFIR